MKKILKFPKINKSENIVSNNKYVYESPDRGKTVYRREHGAPASTRVLHKQY